MAETAEMEGQSAASPPTAKVQLFGAERIRIASPAQALCDVLEAPRYAPSWPELLHVLRTGLALRKISRGGHKCSAMELPDFLGGNKKYLAGMRGDVFAQLRKTAALYHDRIAALRCFHQVGRHTIVVPCTLSVSRSITSQP